MCMYNFIPGCAHGARVLLARREVLAVRRIHNFVEKMVVWVRWYTSRRPKIRKGIGKHVAVRRDRVRNFPKRVQVMEVGALGLRVFVEGEVCLAVVVHKRGAVIFAPATLAF